MKLLAALVDRGGAPIGPAELGPLLAGPGAPGARTTHWCGGSAALGSRAPSNAAPHLSPAGPVVVGDLLLTERHALARRLDLPEPPADDRELVALAYRRWGVRTPEHLTGDFAFILWDPARRLLLAARDPLGVKGLCWVVRDGGRVALATEASRLVPAGAGPEVIDEVAVADHLLGSCLDEERTYFRGIRRLRPGHSLVVDGDRSPALHRHWQIPAELPLGTCSEQEAAEELAARLERAVADRIDRSAPTGVLLSGGLDSATVAAWAAATAPHSPIAVHCAFDRLERCDERPWVDACRRELGLGLLEVASERHPLLGGAFEVPPARETPFMGWESAVREGLGRLSERGVGVVLTGHGGDGLFRGSRRTYLDRLWRGDLGALAEIDREARQTGLGRLRLAYRYLIAPSAPRVGDRWVGRLVGRPRRPEAPPWVDRKLLERTGGVGRLVPGPEHRRFRRRARQDLYDNAVLLQSVERAVRWQERTGRDFGVEMRHPLLDTRLVELVLSLPPEQFFRVGWTKVVLRRAMAGRLPEAVLGRRGKTQFGDFTTFGLARSPIVDEWLADPLVARLGYVDRDSLRTEHEKLCKNESHGLTDMLWCAVTLEFWIRQHFDAVTAADEASNTGHGWR